MPQPGVKRSKVVFDRPEHLNVFGQGGAAASGPSVSGGVKGQDLITLLQQRGDIAFEVAGGGFPAVCYQDPSYGLTGGQPAVSPDSVPAGAKRQPLASFKKDRTFFGDVLPGSAKKTERLDGSFAGTDEREYI